MPGVLFPARVWSGIADGSVTVAFRRWERARARVGARHTTPVGVVVIEDVAVVPVTAITEDDARRAGFADRAAMVADFDLGPDEELHRIEFSFAGDDPRIALREREPDAAELAALVERLDRMDVRMDVRAAGGPWTRQVLDLIAAHPGRRAPDLAAELGRETLPFKADVRKLKALGLTESLKVGYRLSPRGRALLDHEAT